VVYGTETRIPASFGVLPASAHTIRSASPGEGTKVLFLGELAVTVAGLWALPLRPAA